MCAADGCLGCGTPSCCCRDCVTATLILTDLIADLRDEHANGDGYCGAALEAADRAEARLREVTDD